jgi:hypothetical protein
MKFRFSYNILLIIILLIIGVFLFIIDQYQTNSNKIAIVSMMKNPKNIETWLQIHRNLGISCFYIRLEDTPDLVEFLSKQTDVVLDIDSGSGVNEYVEIQHRQEKMVNKALQQARENGIKWLIHIDSDEILNGDLDEIRVLPPKVRSFWMQNVEALYASIPGETDNCFRAKKFVDCGSPLAKCVSYVNGKGGGRTDPDVSCNGPHRFKSTIAENEPRLSIKVEHYESCDFEKYKEKYKNLANQSQNNNIPFPYYNDSIMAAKTESDEKMAETYSKYRVYLGDDK